LEAPWGGGAWMLGVGHAMFAYRREMMHEHAELMATKMADKMKAMSQGK
jgi:hypothetical protein